MNIFFLDWDPKVAASYHCDKHVVKMTLETAQLLSTSHRVLDPDPCEILYRITHVDHPCSVWVRKSVDHYIWTFELFEYLAAEYSKRFRRDHLSWTKLSEVLRSPPSHLKTIGWTDPPLCMPDVCKKEGVVESYRNYYKTEKSHFAKWKTATPDWW